MNKDELLRYESPALEVVEVLLEAAIAVSIEGNPGPTIVEEWVDGGSEWTGGDIEF